MKLLGLQFSDDELTSIEELAGCNYSPEKIALYLDVDKKSFMQVYAIKDGPVRVAYDRGKLESEFKINLEQKKLAEKGNITAAQVFLKEKEQNDIANIRNQLLFGHDAY